MEQKYTGTEGVLFKTEAANQLIKAQEEKFQSDYSYVKFGVFGKKFLEQISPEGTVAFRVYPVAGDIIIRPVDETGKELNIPALDWGGLKDTPDQNSGAASPKCPRQC